MKILSIPKYIALASMLTFPMASQLQAKDKEEKLPDHNLSEWKLGDTLFGEEPTEELLKNKVVVVEYWGIR